jgi:hypothetical protein
MKGEASERGWLQPCRNRWRQSDHRKLCQQTHLDACKILIEKSERIRFIRHVISARDPLRGLVPSSAEVKSYGTEHVTQSFMFAKLKLLKQLLVMKAEGPSI